MTRLQPEQRLVARLALTSNVRPRRAERAGMRRGTDREVAMRLVQCDPQASFRFEVPKIRDRQEAEVSGDGLVHLFVLLS